MASVAAWTFSPLHIAVRDCHVSIPRLRVLCCYDEVKYRGKAHLQSVSMSLFLVSAD
jgi:hypothetical protein